jgi:hypothetical protein
MPAAIAHRVEGQVTVIKPFRHSTSVESKALMFIDIAGGPQAQETLFFNVLSQSYSSLKYQKNLLRATLRIEFPPFMVH